MLLLKSCLRSYKLIDLTGMSTHGRAGADSGFRRGRGGYRGRRSWGSSASIRRGTGQSHNGINSQRATSTQTAAPLQVADNIGRHLFSFVQEQFHARSLGLDFMNTEFKQTREKMIANYFGVLDNQSLMHPRLGNINNLRYLKNAIQTVALRSNVLFCIDVEAFEFDQNKITEIGIAIYDPSSQLDSLFPYVRTIHIIVKEYEDNRNGKFVQDNKDKFLAGKSLVLPMESAVLFVDLLVSHYFVHVPKTEGMGCVLVGHDLRGDVSYFKKIGVNFPQNLQQLDTQKVWAATHGNSGNSLSKLLRFMNIPHTYLHNAGNDAYYTMLLCLNLCDPQSRILNRLDTEFFPEDEPIPQRKLMKGELGVPDARKGKGKRKKGSSFDIMGKVRLNYMTEAIDETFSRLVKD